MLDIRNAALGIRERRSGLEVKPELAVPKAPPSPVEDWDANEPSVHPIDLSADRPLVSLQDMIATSVALKSNLNIEVIKPTSSWPGALFPITASPSRANIVLPSDSVSDTGEMPSHVVQALSGLQREVLLLRNELNFELWLSRENVKHIGRLYQDRILSKGAEAERQGLVSNLPILRSSI